MAIFDLTFHPRWWHQRTGVCFNRSFFTDAQTRMEADLSMRQYLSRFLGEWDKHPTPLSPRPLLDSDLLAGEYLQAQLLGCEILFSDDNLPEVLCADLTEAQVEKLCVPDLDTHPLWRDYEKQLRELYEKFGFVERYLDLSGVQNLAFSLRGQNLFLTITMNRNRHPIFCLFVRKR